MCQRKRRRYPLRMRHFSFEDSSFSSCYRLSPEWKRKKVLRMVLRWCYTDSVSNRIWNRHSSRILNILWWKGIKDSVTDRARCRQVNRSFTWSQSGMKHIQSVTESAIHVPQELSTFWAESWLPFLLPTEHVLCRQGGFTSPQGLPNIYSSKEKRALSSIDIR